MGHDGECLPQQRPLHHLDRLQSIDPAGVWVRTIKGSEGSSRLLLDERARGRSWAFQRPCWRGRHVRARHGRRASGREQCATIVVSPRVDKQRKAKKKRFATDSIFLSDATRAVDSISIYLTQLAVYLLPRTRRVVDVEEAQVHAVVREPDQLVELGAAVAADATQRRTSRGACRHRRRAAAAAASSADDDSSSTRVRLGSVIRCAMTLNDDCIRRPHEGGGAADASAPRFGRLSSHQTRPLPCRRWCVRRAFYIDMLG